MARYESLRKNQLKQNYSQDFLISEILKAASNNEYWQNKQALWTIISGACNQAGKQFYINLKKYVQNIVDIDVCNIHALKSIALESGCENLVENISQNYPIELLNLINIFSINKSNLLQQFKCLYYTSTIPRGFIDNRNQFIIPDNFFIDTIYKIKSNILKIIKLFQINGIHSQKSIDFYIFNPNQNFIINAQSKEKIYYFNKNSQLVYTTKNRITNITLQDVYTYINSFSLFVSYINKNISNLFQIQNSDITPNNNINKYTQNDIIVNCTQSEYTFQLEYKDILTNNIYKKRFLNPFYVLINIIKNNYLLNVQNGISLPTMYYDEQTNSVINLTTLILSIFQSIQFYDEIYIKQFIFFHIYGLFYDKLINSTLLNLFSWNQNYIEPIYVNTYAQYTEEEFDNSVKKYISKKQLDEYKSKIFLYKKADVDFIQYLSLLNSVLFNNEQQKYFKYKPYLFNNNFSIDSDYNSQLRRLLNMDINGNYLGQDLITKIAKQFTDICLQISYIRQNIKTIIQQYTYTGTTKIISQTIRDYFLKNFSKNSNWRFISDSSLKYETDPDLSGIIKPLLELNTINRNGFDSSFFNIDMIEYFDTTKYLNIYADLPNTIIGYSQSSQIIQTSMVLTADYVSTFIVGPSGLVSTLNDDFGYILPPSSTITQASNITTININNQTIEIPVWNASILSSIIIKPNTVISTVIQAGNIIQTTASIINRIPIYAPCASLFSNWNNKFWTRTFNQQDYNSESIKAEIKYFQPYYEQLKQAAGNEKLQYNIYVNKIYPSFQKIWQVFAPSGFAEDIYYLGRAPGIEKTQNIANSVFPTIAALQNINGLYEADDSITNSILYLTRFLYDSTSKYINLLTRQILKMSSYQTGLPIQRLETVIYLV